MSDRHFSFEFFPPKTDRGREKLLGVHRELAELNPEFFSVTFGAGGSTRDGTLDTVTAIQERGSAAAPHISCIGSSKSEIDQLLNTYQERGINRLVALRGDMPSGQYAAGDFAYANDLVEHIRTTTGDHFHIEVAAYPEFHPQAKNAEDDLTNFVRKVNAGANSAITQYFYNLDAYLRFVEAAQGRGVEIPIIPGIMPITNYSKLARFSDACGAEIPRWIRKRLEAYGDDSDSIKAFGQDIVTQLCSDLLDNGAPGLHFYTMNQTEPNRAIWQALNLG
ncbi:5,10-methylenetetrahydrofolate reductase [gamma proteobacterium HTCC5015]|nr:5,10-methylenetetrahydrofolate reductase [gamma proteobacterium HTCC5015]